MPRTETQIGATGNGQVGSTRKRRKRRLRPNRRLQALRINAGMSPNDLARAAGISGNTVRAAEAGMVPSPHVQLAIAGVFERLPLDIWPIGEQVGRE